MSSAEELLAAMEEIAPVHDHNISDPDSYFVIDPDTRQITNLSQSPNVLMQNDHNSEVYTFQIPRFVEGHDMTKCNRVRLHYINAGKRSGETYKDVYEMTDLMVNPRDNTTLISTWTIKRQATQYAGKLSFAIQYICVDKSYSGEDPNNISYEWHTDIYKDVEVRETIVNSEEAVSDYTDILEEWYQMLFGSESSLIKSVTDAANEQKEAIELKGEEVLASIPADYATTHSMAEEALRKKANAIEQTAEGEMIFIDDSSDAYLLGLNLYGKTTQVTTTGAQLFDRNAATTGLLETDGSITVDGAYLTSDYIPVTPNTAYCQTRKDSIRAKFYDANKTALSNTWDTQLTGAGTFTTPANAYYLRTTISVKLVDVFMLNEGKTNLPYEPYSGRLVSPCPEYPQDLTPVVSDTVTVSILGSNLIDATKLNTYANTSSDVSADGYTITVVGGSKAAYSSSTLSLSHLVGALRGKKVYFAQDSMTQTNADAKGGPQINIKRTANTDYIALNSMNLAKEIDIPYDVVDLSIGVYTNNTGAALTADSTLVSSGLRLSLVECEWEQYRSVSEEQFAVGTLPGIPVSQNGNYTDANGQQWICDEIDFARGVYIQRVVKLDNNEPHKTLATLTNVEVIKCANEHLLVGKNAGVGLCSISDLYQYSENDRVHYYIENKAAVIYVPVGYDYVTKPITVMAQLQTPIETPLTDEQITLYKRLKTNYHNTTILNDAGAHMAVKYAADTKMFFENHSIATDAQVEAAVTAYLERYFGNAEGVSF